MHNRVLERTARAVVHVHLEQRIVNFLISGRQLILGAPAPAPSHFSQGPNTSLKTQSALLLVDNGDWRSKTDFWKC